MADVPLIDVNITLGQWPTRRVPCDEFKVIAAKLREHNVTEAWAGSYDGIFHQDLGAVNDRLVAACSEAARESSRLSTGTLGATKTPLATSPALQLRPFGSINPLNSNWRAELNRCADTLRMPGIRLHPNYHGYPLDHPDFAAALTLAAERKSIVQVVVIMEDSRMMHPLMRVPPVDIGPLANIVAKIPDLKLVLLNATSAANRTDKLFRVLDAGEVFVEIAMLDVAPCIETLLEKIPVERLLFGSHTPSFYFEGALLKLKESRLSPLHQQAITHDNARRLLPAT